MRMLAYTAAQYETKRLPRKSKFTVGSAAVTTLLLYPVIWFHMDISFFYGFLALPVTFKRELQNEVSKEGGTSTFSCELSKPGAMVDWRKGRVILKSGEKYEIKQDGKITTLIVHNIEKSDAGYFSCKTKDSETTAELTVQGKACKWSALFS